MQVIQILQLWVGFEPIAHIRQTINPVRWLALDYKLQTIDYIYKTIYDYMCNNFLEQKNVLYDKPIKT